MHTDREFACAAPLEPGRWREVNEVNTGSCGVNHLSKSAFAYTSEKNEMKEIDLAIKVDRLGVESISINAAAKNILRT